MIESGDLNLTEKNNKTLQNLERLIASGKVNKALRKIQWLVLKITTDNRYTAVKFDSPELDFFCEKIGEHVAQQVIHSYSPTSNSAVYSTVIVCSRLQASGGHTRVIEDFIRHLHLPNKELLVLVTEVPGKSDRKHIGERMSALGATIEWSKRGNLAKRLFWLQKRLLSANPDDVYLFNHHEDSVAVSAMQIAKEAKIHFYHHGDHHLSLGLHLRGAEHIDIHAFGYNNCKDNLGIERNSYLPLVTEDRGPRPYSLGFINGGNLITCTAAGKNKVEVKHAGISYIDFIPMLLSSTKGRHIHIGKLSWFGRYRIKRSLLKAGVDLSAFVYIPWVQSVWDALHEHGVDVYISSFPVTGGRTLIEAMGAGTPVILFDNPKSRLLSGIDLVYPQAFLWDKVSVLLSYLKSKTPEELAIESEIARDYFLEHYRDELLKETLSQQVVLEPPLLNSTIRKEPKSLNSVSISNKYTDRKALIWKFIYLRLKYLRSVIQNTFIN